MEKEIIWTDRPTTLIKQNINYNGQTSYSHKLEKKDMCGLS
jgi:hypothetical protein